MFINFSLCLTAKCDEIALLLLRHIPVSISNLQDNILAYKQLVRKEPNLTSFRELFPDNSRVISQAFFKKHVVSSVSHVFGETAAAINIDLLKYNPAEKRGILRVPKELYVKVRASLTLAGKYEDIVCAYTVHKATPILLGLTGMSTTVLLYL